MQEMKALQTDYFSIPAKILIPFLKDLKFDSKQASMAQKRLLDWNFVLDKTSVAAGIYVEWENQIIKAVKKQFFPEEVCELHRTDTNPHTSDTSHTHSL